jgi:hypothetical protein
MRISRKARACAVLTIVSVLVLSAFAASASALPARFWGAVPQAQLSKEQFARLHRGGVDSIRVPLQWSGLQSTKDGPINWGGVDATIENAALNGVEVLPFFSGAPKWAVPLAPVPNAGTAKAPAHLPASGAAAGAWSRFLRAAVERYGPAGDFWAEHPAVPERPVRIWQIWNEENFDFFVARPNPAEYGQLVKVSYSAIKGVDSGAQLVLGGMFAKPKGGQRKTGNHTAPNYFASYFLEQMYKRTPGIKTKFSGVALHPYTNKYQELTPEIEEFRGALKASGDAAKGLWITELGWSSQPPPANRLENVFAKGVAGQNTQLKGAFSLLSKMQAKWRLQRVYWFSVDDASETCNFCNGSGLFGDGFTPKPSWYTYVKFAGGTP